jgi:pimeloyl-ACP methyl ester carboxylesterase
MTEPQVLAFLSRVQCPVILFRAKQGYAFDVVKMEARVKAVGQCRVVELEGGHHVHLDHPENVGAEIVDFWGTRASARSSAQP